MNPADLIAAGIMKAIDVAGAVYYAFAGHLWVSYNWTTPWVCTCWTEKPVWRPGAKPEGAKDFYCYRCPAETDAPKKWDRIYPEHPSHEANRRAYAAQEAAKAK